MGESERCERWIKREAWTHKLIEIPNPPKDEDQNKRIAKIYLFMMSNYRNFQFILFFLFGLLLLLLLLQLACSRIVRIERERVILVLSRCSSLLLLFHKLCFSGYFRFLRIDYFSVYRSLNVPIHTKYGILCMPCLTRPSHSPFVCYYSARFSNG